MWALCTLKFQLAQKRKTCTGVCSWSESCVLENASPVNGLQADRAGSIVPLITIWCVSKMIPDVGSCKVSHEAIVTGRPHNACTQLERIFCCHLPEEVKNIQYTADWNGKSSTESSHFTLDSWHQLRDPAGTFSLGLVASTFNVFSGKPLGQQLCPVLLFSKETSVLSSGSTCQNLCDYKQRALQGVVNASRSLEHRPWKLPALLSLQTLDARELLAGGKGIPTRRPQSIHVGGGRKTSGRGGGGESGGWLLMKLH